ncbi:CdaR family transcriptional regulator [Priestia endophytica]|uniref:CdaR family transcriptional regulator n=1 Tax=Priestia endophytica TaxID=135735 RepID=UPI000F53930A|nr:sugar diacid recognition domain-containing protein [Priestia endophytica]MED4071527.1 sugar diacid recognition domain-containing protein [Priestia endophytica]RPK07606.1 hypothetical protein FH5_05317 [Priestia endophytica]
MLFLTHELAQEIVERTMKILNRNINVMNSEGIIIGSGDQTRINQLHAGALLVLKNEESIELDQVKASEMKGSKPGINLPIYFNNQPVGVIGITGEPHEIQNYAQLVKMAAELVLEQSVLLDRVQWKERLQSEIVNQLISGMQMNEKGIRERLEFLGVNLNKSRVAVVLKQSTRIDFSTHKIIRALRYELSKEDLIGVAINDDIIILKNVINETDFRSWLSLFKKWIKKYDNRLVIGTGSVVDDLLDMKSSFQYAKRAIEIGQKLQPEKCFYHYEEYQLEISLSQLTSSKEMFHFYHRLIEHDKNGELIKTLEIYIEESGELNKVAERLFIHRNTLRYRLERILTITGKDPKNMKDVMELYIAKLLNDLT